MNEERHNWLQEDIALTLHKKMSIQELFPWKLYI